MTALFTKQLFAASILIVLAILAIVLLCLAWGSTMDRVDWTEETYRVKSGDSLWTLSGKYCPDNVDRREWIEEVQKLNGLTSSFIYAGQRLTVLVPAD